MMLTDSNRTQEIELIALQVIRDVFGDLEDCQFPLNLNAIVEKSSLQLNAADFEDSSIAGYYNKANGIIAFAKNDSIERQLFTVAHELGHYYLHNKIKTEEILYRREMLKINEEEQQLEMEANRFAASLLMPAEVVRSVWQINSSIKELAKLFGVSEVVAFYRLRNLNMINK